MTPVHIYNLDMADDIWITKSVLVFRYDEGVMVEILIHDPSTYITILLSCNEGCLTYSSFNIGTCNKFDTGYYLVQNPDDDLRDQTIYTFILTDEEVYKHIYSELLGR